MIEYHNFAISNEIMNLSHFQWILKSLSQTLIGKFFPVWIPTKILRREKGGGEKEGESVPPWQPHLKPHGVSKENVVMGKVVASQY